MQLANAWKQSGRISLWRYTENERNFPGWHLNGDADGCKSLLALLDALAADGEGSRTVAIIAPTKTQLSVPNNKAGLAAWKAPSKLRITFSPTSREWRFPANLDPAELTVGADWLQPLRDGISGIPAGRGDYAVGDRIMGLSLWFWW